MSHRLFSMIMCLGGVARRLPGQSLERIEKGPPHGLNTYVEWASGGQNEWLKNCC